MYARLILLAAVGVIGATGCASSQPRPQPEQRSETTQLLLRDTSGLDAAGAAIAGALNEWQHREHSNVRIVARGPTIVGWKAGDVATASALADRLREAVAAHVNPALSLSETLTEDAGHQARDDTLVLDALASWEPDERHHRGTLILDLVDPASGKVVFTTKQTVRVDETMLASGRHEEGRAREAASDTAPVVGDDRRVAPRHAMSRQVAGDARHSGASRYQAVERFEHGVVYYESSKLARKIVLFREEAAVLADGTLQVRLTFVNRGHNTKIDLRCEFYDRNGQPAGSVRDVTLHANEGEPTNVALVSLQPADIYVLFVRD